MNRPARMLGLSCALLALAAPVAAQVDGRRQTPAEAERAMARFSRCTIESTALRRRAERFVRLIPGQPNFRDEGAAIALSRCVPANMGGQLRMRFPPILFRSALFSAMYRREFGRIAPGDVRAAPPLSLADEFEGDVGALPDDLRLMRALGDCAARVDTVRVHALLRTEVGSQDERPALDAAIPVLADCLPAGRELRFSRGMLRGILAEGLYKLRKAALARPAIAPAGGDA